MKTTGHAAVLRGVIVLALALAMFGCVERAMLPDGVVDLLSKAAGTPGCQGCLPVEGEAPPDEEVEGDLVVWLPGNVPLALMHIPAGTYMRGAYPGEQDASTIREEPQHQVTLTQDFYMGRYPVTKRQWEAVMGTTPWHRRTYVLDDANSPAVWVNWNEVQEFVTALNAHITNTGQGPANFRLPTEAEWEYAGRAGTTTRFYWGDDPDNAQVGAHAWYRDNSYDLGNRYAHKVGLKLPNAWDLYDISGNVYEWCLDWFDTYPDGPVTDPTGPDTGTRRVLRGGSWHYRADRCRSAYRDHDTPTYASYTVGFRLIRF